MATEQELPEADAPDETIRTEVIALLEDPSVDRARETVEYLGEKGRSRRPGRGNADR